MKTSDRERKETPMNTWKTVVRRTLATELRVRDDAGGWRFWAAVSVAVGILAGWGAGEGRAPSWDAYAGVRHEPTVLGLTVTHITNFGLDIPADAR